MALSKKKPPYKTIYTEPLRDDFREVPKARKKVGVVIFWLLFATFVVGLFIINWTQISATMESALWPAWFKSRTQEKDSDIPLYDIPLEETPSSPRPVVQTPVQPRETAPNGTGETFFNEPEGSVLPGENPESWEQTGAPPPATVPSEPSFIAGGGPPPEASPAPVPETPVSPEPSPQIAPTPILRDRPLYFIQVDRDGTILRTKVTRTIPSSDAPMLDVLQSLLAGPTSEEQGQGLRSLISPGTKILTVTVRTGTAYINFSEEFQYNIYGVEGYAAQLQQIIWTVTEFPNVKDVQILIEGRRVDYLGEGIWIGSPISREML